MLKQSQLDLCGRVDFTREVPLLGRDEGFSFACAGCGDCCRGREDLVLSGFDLCGSRRGASAAPDGGAGVLQGVHRGSEPSARAAAGPGAGGGEQLPLPDPQPLRHP